MSSAQTDHWRCPSPPPVGALTLGLIRHTRSLWTGIRVDHNALLAILRTLFVTDARGGRFAPLNSSPSLIWVLMPLIFFVLGLITGIGALVGRLSPLQWMATVQLTCALSLAGPILLRDATRLLDDPDRAVLDGRPISPRTRAAAQSIHVLARHLPNALAFMAGPMLLGTVLHGPAVLLCVPLATLASLVVLLTLLPAGWSLLSRVLGLRRLQRLSAISEVAVLSLLIAGSGLLGPLLLPLLGASAAVIMKLPAEAYVLPPVQWGGLLALVLGDVSRATISLSVLAVITPLASALLYFSLAKRSSVIPSLVSNAEGWPGSRLAALFCRTPEGRAGFGLARALFARDAVIRKHIWPLTIGGAVFLVVGLARTGQALGSFGHWVPLLVWPLFPTIMFIGLNGVQYSAHAKGACAFYRVSRFSRERALTGAVRGAFLAIVLPASLGFLLLAWALLDPRAALDILVFLELGFILIVEQKVRQLSPLPFSILDPTSGGRANQHSVAANARTPVAAMGDLAGLVLVIGGCTVALALLHLSPYAMIAATIALLVPMRRAWHRLDLLRTET